MTTRKDPEHRLAEMSTAEQHSIHITDAMRLQRKFDEMGIHNSIFESGMGVRGFRRGEMIMPRFRNPLAQQRAMPSMVDFMELVRGVALQPYQRAVIDSLSGLANKKVILVSKEEQHSYALDAVLKREIGSGRVIVHDEGHHLRSRDKPILSGPLPTMVFPFIGGGDYDGESMLSWTYTSQYDGPFRSRKGKHGSRRASLLGFKPHQPIPSKRELDARLPRWVERMLSQMDL